MMKAAIFTIVAAAAGLLSQVRADSAVLHPYDKFVGKQVAMQGIGWIQRVSDSAMFLVTPAAAIWLEPWTSDNVQDFEKWNGRLIEVTGMLREGVLEGPKEAEHKGPVTLVQHYKYFHMKEYVIRAIDRVSAEITDKKPNKSCRTNRHK